MLKCRLIIIVLHVRLRGRSEGKLHDLQLMLQSAPRVEEIETLKATMAATSSSSEEVHRVLADREAALADKDRNLEQLKGALQEQVTLLHTKEVLLAEAHRNLAERTAALEEATTQLRSTEAMLVVQREDVARVGSPSLTSLSSSRLALALIMLPAFNYI